MMLLVVYGCKKESAQTTKAMPAATLVDSLVGLYHMTGTTVPPNGPTQNIDRYDSILSGGANTILYRGGTFTYNAADSSVYQFSVSTGVGSYNATLIFPKPLNDSVFYTDYFCPNPISCTNSNLRGKKVH